MIDTVTPMSISMAPARERAPMRHRRRQAAAGMTLIDMMVALMLITLVVGGLYTWLLSTTRAAGTTTSKSTLNLAANRTLERISGHLIAAGLATLNPVNPGPPLGTSSLTFQGCDGWAAGARAWETPTRIELVRDPDDADDGVDNDGDGFTDEGLVRITKNVGLPNEVSVLLADDVAEYFDTEEANAEDDNENGLVDERGLSFSVAGDLLSIRLSLLGKLPGGQVIRCNVETSVRLRN